VTSAVVLDTAALAALAGGATRAKETVRAAMTAALHTQREVVVPAVVLAEMYRGRHHNQVVDACLSRETGLGVRNTDRSLARLVGGILTAADKGSAEIVDAHVVAVALESGGGVCLTGDADDLGALAASYPNLQVVDVKRPV
jgi:predicted nucleic acid-binding protein